MGLYNRTWECCFFARVACRDARVLYVIHEPVQLSPCFVQRQSTYGRRETQLSSSRSMLRSNKWRLRSPLACIVFRLWQLPWSVFVGSFLLATLSVNTSINDAPVSNGSHEKHRESANTSIRGFGLSPPGSVLFEGSSRPTGVVAQENRLPLPFSPPPETCAMGSTEGGRRGSPPDPIKRQRQPHTVAASGPGARVKRIANAKRALEIMQRCNSLSPVAPVVTKHQLSGAASPYLCGGRATA